MSSTAYETDYNQWLKETVKQLRRCSSLNWDCAKAQLQTYQKPNIPKIIGKAF